MNETDFLNRMKTLFDKDGARISTFSNGRKYLIMGKTRIGEAWTSLDFNESSKEQFEYLEEKVIASGNTIKQLYLDALHYKALETLGNKYYAIIFDIECIDENGQMYCQTEQEKNNVFNGQTYQKLFRNGIYRNSISKTTLC